MPNDIATTLTVKSYLPLARLVLGQIGYLHPANIAARYEFRGTTADGAALVAFVVQVGGEVIQRREFVVLNVDCAGLAVGRELSFKAALEVVAIENGVPTLLPLDIEGIKAATACN